MSMLSWLLTNTPVTLQARFVEPVIQRFCWSFLSHPCTVFSISIFKFPVIWLFWGPKFQTERQRAEKKQFYKMIDERDRKAGCSWWSNLSSSGEPSTHNHLPSVCESVNPIQNLSWFTLIFSLSFWSRNVLTENIHVSALSRARHPAIKGSKQHVVPARFCFWCEPDLLLGFGTSLWPFPMVSCCWWNNSTVL